MERSSWEIIEKADEGFSQWTADTTAGVARWLSQVANPGFVANTEYRPDSKAHSQEQT